MKEPLISVIVPIFNVEPWLKRCVESIRSQTYSNLEIILVDDGSLDKCGVICDDYVKLDNRIKVIHRKNGGLSAARNSGLENCNGEYIGFVDSDDFIHREMYSKLYSDIRKHGTHLAFCQTLLRFSPEISFPSPDAKTICYPSDEIIHESLKKEIWFSACTKLYHRTLFDGVRYPEGRTNEDYPVTIRIFDRCDRIAVNYNKLYAYCKREGSITTTPLSERSFDRLSSAEEVYLFMKDTHKDYSYLAGDILMSVCVGLLLETDGNLDYASKRESIFALIRKYYPQVKRHLHLTASQKFLLYAANAGDAHYSAASKLYRKFKKQ
jgi:glycosyltransferase involved in cell wall biosynthesis